MIHFDDWLLTKDEGPVIARQFDNLTRRLEILGDIPEGWSWTLLVQAGTHLDIVALAPMDGGLGVDLTKEMLAIGGYHTLQLKGVQGELVRHTNQLHNVLIPASLSGDANWPEVPSEFSQMEANIRELGEHPPIPGDGGYWLVWDLERDEYVTSDLPLPDVSVGPPGQAATVKVGETVTGDPGTQAAVENTGTENEAVLRFTIPRGAAGPTGATPAISVEVTGLPAGSEPTVEVSGTPEAPVIALGIPAGRQGDPGGKGDPGDPGQTPNITIGQVETLPAESSVTASITGQTPNLVLNLGIPQGQQGDPGQAATIEIVETETVSSDAPAAMVELPDSTPQARRYKAQVPQGVQGPAGIGLPALSGPEDAGKVPVANEDGTDWVLGTGGGGGVPQRAWRQIADLDFAQLREQGVSSFSDDTIKNATKVLVDCQTIINAHSATDSGLWITFNDKPAPLANVWFPTYHNGTSGTKYQKALVEFDGGFVFAIRGGAAIAQNNNTPSNAQVAYGTMLPFDGFAQKINFSWGLGDSAFTDILSGKLLIYVYEEVI